MISAKLCQNCDEDIPDSGSASCSIKSNKSWFIVKPANFTV